MGSTQVNLRIGADCTERAYVEFVAPNVCKLEATPLLATQDNEPVYAGDVVEVESLPDGAKRIIRLLRRSGMRHFTWTVPRFFAESDEYVRFGREVEAAGGKWEGAGGGFLWVHLPPDSSFDPEAALSRRIAAAKPIVAEA